MSSLRDSAPSPGGESLLRRWAAGDSRAGRALGCLGRSLWGKGREAGLLPALPQPSLISAYPAQDSPKRPKEAEDPEGEEKEEAALEGERPLPVEAEKNSTPSEPGSGRGPPPEEEEEEEEEETAKEDSEAPGMRDHER